MIRQMLSHLSLGCVKNSGKVTLLSVVNARFITSNCMTIVFSCKTTPGDVEILALGYTRDSLAERTI